MLADCTPILFSKYVLPTHNLVIKAAPSAIDYLIICVLLFIL
jgi:hypothetical protein